MPKNGTTVLVVDDDPAFAESMAHMIKAAGYEEVVALNGADGLRSARELIPALVLCDLSMPGLGGVEVLRLLRDDPATTHIPRIMMSGHVFQHLNGIAADDFLAKPIVPSTIHRLLNQFVKRTDENN